MAYIYADLIKEGIITINEVPDKLKEKVLEILNQN